MAEIRSIAVYGAGSWGTALALQLARNQLKVTLWDISSDHLKTLAATRENQRYLPKVPLPDNLFFEADLAHLAAQHEAHLIVVPSHGFRALLQQLKPHLQADDQIYWATKGLELDTGKLLHEVLLEELPDHALYGLVSGPTFANEVAHGFPTAMTAAATNMELAQQLAQAFHGQNYRVYTSDDIIGVELGGAIKNVLAIGAGISDGLGFGANARAAIITRGLAEMMRLGQRMGARSETFMGLAGLGDLVLTCTDNQSRNRRLGLALGKGDALDKAISDIGQAVEGVKTANAVELLAKRIGVEMPICHQVYRILYEQLPPRRAVQELIGRDLKSEF